MATSVQHIERFDVTLVTWATILLGSSQEISDDITTGLWTQADLRTCSLQVQANKILVETEDKQTASAGGVTTYTKYRYHVPWTDVQPNLGNFSTTPITDFESGEYDTQTTIMTFILKEKNV